MIISRTWHAFGLQPHRSDTFKLSPDPQLIEKVRDIVGLYMNPPDHAMVLCVDENSQIQALDRYPTAAADAPGATGARRRGEPSCAEVLVLYVVVLSDLTRFVGQPVEGYRP
jgi:hypothetical protein